MQSLLEKLLSDMSATALKRTSSPVFYCEQIKRNFFCFISFKHSLGYVLQNRSFQKFGKTYRKIPLPEFLSDKVVHDQVSHFIKNRLHVRCFAVNFPNCFKHLFYKTPPVSVSHFNSTFLTLSLRRTYIYMFQALLGFRYI